MRALTLHDVASFITLAIIYLLLASIGTVGCGRVASGAEGVAVHAAVPAAESPR